MVSRQRSIGTLFRVNTGPIAEDHHEHEMGVADRPRRISSRRWWGWALFTVAIAMAMSASAAAGARHHGRTKQSHICRPHHHVRGCIKVPRGVAAPHRDQDAGAGPGFTGQSVDGLGATSAGEQGAVDWAYQHLGDQSYDGWCGKFAAYAFNVPALGYETAWDAGVAFGLHGGTAPPGSLVFFKRDSSNGYAGHIGIALPGNQMISAQSNGVHVANLALAYWKALYAGWSPPPASWPGRPPTGGAPPLFPASPPASPAPPKPSPSAPTSPPQSPPGNGPSVYPHHVVGTCAEGACGLIERAGPGYSSYAEVGVLQEGQEIDIVCQTIGQPVAGHNATSAVWDKLTNGSYVSDYYTDTPNVGTWSPPIPQC